MRVREGACSGEFSLKLGDKSNLFWLVGIFGNKLGRSSYSWVVEEESKRR